MTRKYNFCAGPAALPEPVLAIARDELLDWHERGMSIMEMSHRSADFEGVASQAEATLREHRGDGHVAALVAAGLTGCEVLAWRSVTDLSREVLQPYRGWTDEEWDAATIRLRERGWLDGDGRPTDTGVAEFGEIEAATDRACAPAWRGVDTERLASLLAPIARACRSLLPDPNPIGLPTTQ